LNIYDFLVILNIGSGVNDILLNIQTTFQLATQYFVLIILRAD